MMLGNIWGDCGMVKGNAQPHLALPPAPDKADKARVVADVQLRFGRQGEGLVNPFWIDSDKG